MKNLIIALLFVGALTIHNNILYADETEGVYAGADEIVVTSSYIGTKL